MKKFKYLILAFAFILITPAFMVGCGDKDYSVNVDACQHGIIMVDKSSAKEGEEIKISVQAEQGYELSVITCNGVKLESMTFTMPKKDVTLSAIFVSNSAQIALQNGTYVCRGQVYAEENGDYYDPAQYYIYNHLTFKDENKVDGSICMYGVNDGIGYYDFSNVNYTRVGNSLTGQWNDYSFEVKILDDKSIVLLADDKIFVYYFMEDVALSNGKYTAIYEEGRVAELEFLSNGQFSLKLTETQTGEVYIDASGEYYIRGNRLYSSAVDEKFYCIIQTEHLEQIENRVVKFYLNYVAEEERGDVTFVSSEDPSTGMLFNLVEE